MIHHRKSWASFGILIASAMLAVPAFATMGSGFQAAPIVGGHFGTLDVKAEKIGKWDLLLKTKDSTDVSADRLTIQPEGHSGWHSHPAPVFVTVTSGTVQWYDEQLCTAHTYTAGQSYIEPAGRAHDVRNSGATVAEFVAITVKPAGYVGPAFRVDEPTPNNCD